MDKGEITEDDLVDAIVAFLDGFDKLIERLDKEDMTRSTRGSTLMINSNSMKTVEKEDGTTEQVSDFPEAWGQHEWVRARTLTTAGDREWINAHSSKAIMDASEPDGVRMEIDSVASMIATVARMTLEWNLTRDVTDQWGNPIDKGDGKYAQEPIPLPEKCEARLAVIRELHEDDLAYIFTKMVGEQKPLPSKEQQTAFLASANGHSSENLPQTSASPTP